MFTRPAKLRKPRPKTLIAGVVALAAATLAFGAQAASVGQTWRVFPDKSAASRDYLGRAQVRAVVWYPAADGAAEEPIGIGRADGRTFEGGLAAPEAPLAKTAGKLPLIVMSHGSGGTALQYGWLGAELARRGYVVVAVDHPGASGGERATDAGTQRWWQRADDISAAIDGTLADPTLGPRIDAGRIGMVGYSLGGSTGLLLAGAKVKAADLLAGPGGNSIPYDQFMAAVRGHREPRIKAFALIAPAVLPAIDLAPANEGAPLLIVTGDADTTVPPATNALAVRVAVRGVRVETLPGVAHNDFLQPCTEVGRARYAELCKQSTAQRLATHATTAKLIGDFLDPILGRPKAKAR